MDGKIQGPALLGFVEEFESVYLGAAKPLPRRTVALAPKKGAAGAGVKGDGIVMHKPPPQTKHSPHKMAMTGLVKAGKRALEASKRAAAKAAVRPAPAASTQIARKVTAVGAAALTPKQKAAVEAHQKAMAAAKAAAANLDKAAKKAAIASKAATDYAKKTIPYLRAKLAGKGAKVNVGAVLGYIEQRGGIEALDGDEVLGLLSAIGADDAAYDPSMYEAGTAYDPSAAAADTPMMTQIDSGLIGPSAGQVVTAPDGTVLYDPATDPAIIPMPVRGQKMSLDDISSGPWKNVPDDAIVYDESKGWPRYSKGSSYYFYGPKNANGGQFGMVWGYDHMNMPASTETRWIKRFGQAAVTGNDNWDDGFSSDAAAADASAKSDSRNLEPGKVYGPLIGNPDTDFAGLQYATADNKWFWQSDNAPTWATAEADAKIKAANKLTIATNMAAAQAQAAQMLKDAADQRAQQAAQDAQNALAESQAASQANVADLQAQGQQSALETQAQQFMLQQAQSDQQQKAAQAQLQLEAGRLLLEQARAAPPASAQGYPGAEDDGYGDDGSQGEFVDDGANQGYLDASGDQFAEEDFE